MTQGYTECECGTCPMVVVDDVGMCPYCLEAGCSNREALCEQENQT